MFHILVSCLYQRLIKTMFIIVCVLGHLHIFASNTEHPTINDYSEEIEFASAVRAFDTHTGVPHFLLWLL